VLLIFALFYYTDLKAFERRLTEVISCLRPATIRWRILLVLATVCTAIGAWQWLNDPLTTQVSFTDSLVNHLFFTLSSLILGNFNRTATYFKVINDSVIPMLMLCIVAEF